MKDFKRNVAIPIDHRISSGGWLFAAAVAVFLALLVACKSKTRAESGPNAGTGTTVSQQAALAVQEPPFARIPVDQVVPVSRFFHYLDQIVRQYDTLTSYPLTENLLLRANPWILDTLVRTDYYYQMSLGYFLYDQRKAPVLKPGDTLLIPGSETGATLLEKMNHTWLDINIPAFEMRILEGDSVLFSMPVRVGKNQKKYLELAGNRVDLRTHTGVGTIIRVNRFPLFLDPVTGKKFEFTKRDDHQVTYMPQIPWLEPSINGMRYGQMIHPTTNPRTLGKAASNGCIGVGEADAWRVYVFAPLGTKVVIRYDLQQVNEKGDTLRYQDIYNLRKSVKLTEKTALAGYLPRQPEGVCVCDTMF